MKISFHGAAREVTGSCHLVEVAKTKILLDCGLFQSGEPVDNEKQNDFDFDPSTIDYLLLSHAHLDHFGRIPLLVKRGFSGEVISTLPTKDLSALAMLDSAKYNARQGNKFSNRSENLFDTKDVNKALDLFGRTAVYEKPIRLNKKVTATYFNAGHIIGSASIFLEVNEGDNIKKLVFSADIGNNNKPIITNPTLPPKSDLVIMESTYGDRNHTPVIKSLEEYYDAISSTVASGGNVVNPVLAIERAQEMLYILRAGLEAKKMPKNIKAFLDSPLAIKATNIVRNYPNYFNEETRGLIESGKDPFSFPNLELTETVSESKAIRNTRRGAVILAGSGMAMGGRVIYHLRDNLPRPESSIIISNFVPEGSLLKKIIDGEKSVQILGEDIPVRAKIYTIGGFSAHAGQNELIKWQRNSGKPGITFLVHGEENPMQTLATKLRRRGNQVKMPTLHETFEV